MLDDHRQNELYEVYVKRSVEGSCKWVLDRPWFLKWSSVDFPSRTAKYLWINGPAGFGKSILCAKVIQNLLTSLDKPVAYFLCDSETRDPFVAVRFWLSQLVSHERAFGIVRGKWETTEAQRATREEILSLLQEIVSAAPGCTLVLDGLDECDFAKGSWPGRADDSISMFLESLRQVTTGTSTRVLIMSRNEPEIRYGILDGSPDGDIFEHQITPDDVRDDVIAYSRSIVNEKLSRKPDATKDGIAKRLAERCNGQFLWVRLQQETLRSGKSERNLHEAISSTPHGIEYFYERNWKRIMDLPNEDRTRAFSILHWTAFSVRPLTVSEISGALVVGDHCGEIQLDDLPDSINEDYISTEITELCGSLLEVRDSLCKGNPGWKTLHLAHFSVKEYILRKIPTRRKSVQLSAIPSQPTEAIESMVLARKCLRFVNSQEAWLETSAVGAEDILGAFRTYAAGSWYRKAMIRNMKDTELVDSINRFFHPGNPHWASWKAWFDQEYTEAKRLNIQSGVETAGPLYYAARLGLTETVNYLIHEVKCDVDSRGYHGETSLQAASREGNLKIVRALLEQGADVSLSDMKGLTPVRVASINGNAEVVKVLIQFGTDVNVGESHRRTAIHMACHSGHAEVVRVLIQLGADFNITDSRGWAPIHMACYSGNAEVLKTLLEHGVDVDIATNDRWTAINIAASHGHTDVVRTLLQHGADISVPNTKGLTPLSTAAMTDAKTVKLLLEWGADIETKDSYGATPLLQQARRGGPTQVIKVLLEWGADIEAKNSAGYTPLVAALAKNKADVAKLLLEWDADSRVKGYMDRTPIMYASLNGDHEIIELLLQKGADPASADQIGCIALHYAAEKGRIKSAEILLQSPRINVDALDRTNQTPLFTAAARGHLRMVDTLLSHGADPNRMDRYDSTPLSAAIRNGHGNVVERLIMLTDDPINRRDAFGRTSFWWAAKAGETKIMAIMREWARDNGITIDDCNVDVEASTRPLANPNIRRYCDVCTRNILSDHAYHSCEVCTDFDACFECFEMGMRCLVSSHEWTYRLPKEQV